jgi:hypothetical protein
LFACVYSLPLLLVLSLVGSPGADDSATRDAAWIGAAAGLAFLPQSMHRADVEHLMQVVPGCLLALAGLWGLEGARGRRMTRAVPAAAAAVATMLGILASLGRLTFPMWRGESWSDRLRAALLPASQVAMLEENGVQPIPRDAIRVLRTCAPEGTSVAVYPFSPQLAYFSGRVHGGAYLVLAPGDFDDGDSLATAFEALGRDRVSLVLWDEAFMFDGRSDRRSVVTHAELHRRITEQFVRIGSVDEFTVYANPAWSKPGAFVESEGRCR